MTVSQAVLTARVVGSRRAPFAQVAFTNKDAWSIVGPYIRQSGRLPFEMPPVSCPVIDVAGVDWLTARETIQDHVGPGGVRDLDELIAELAALGARVRYPRHPGARFENPSNRKRETMNDLDDALDRPYTPPVYEVWGSIALDAWKAALVKGAGKVPFDPAVHDNPVTAVKVVITPLDGQAHARQVVREYITDNREWGLMQASVLRLGVKPSALDGKFCRAALKDTGETYANERGEVKRKTYPHLLAVFDTEQACREDFELHRGHCERTSVSESIPH